MRFENGHVYVAVCQPSRQSMMTGRYNHRIGALGFSPIDENITTLQEVLDEAGYINGILGKVPHLCSPTTNTSGPTSATGRRWATAAMPSNTTMT
jgi:arylsulfatase A-like enzyme